MTLTFPYQEGSAHQVMHLGENSVDFLNGSQEEEKMLGAFHEGWKRRGFLPTF